MYTFKQFYIPDRMMEGIQLYITHHCLTGEFLQAVICNDLREAIGRADDENMANLPAYVAFFHNEAPYDCWGSEEKMNAWLSLREGTPVTPTTCTYDPKAAKGAPLGMYHCPECGQMVLAGVDHPDYSLLDSMDDDDLEEDPDDNDGDGDFTT